ncbi:MAG: hypothetical protein EXQ59_03400 [Acidobacteria bacterium]|nr:hypothetical protein [Acidobacteriota bacterium]
MKGVRRWVGGMFFASALLRVGIGGSLAATAFHDPLFWGLMALVALTVSVLTGRWPVVASVASAIAGGSAMVATLLPMFPDVGSALPQINLDVVRQSFSALSHQLGAVATTFLLGLWVHGIGGRLGPRNGVGNIAVAVRAALLTALAFCLAGAVQTSQLEGSWMVALGALLGLAEDDK